MDRLTERYEGRVIPRVDRPKIDCAKCLERLAEYEDIGCTPEQLKQIDKWYAEMCRELAEYKRLEEQGVILRLPCPLGTKIYCIHNGFVEEGMFFEMSCFKFKDYYKKSWFLTREEAEQALADRRVRG